MEEITTGELGRRMDEVRDTVRELVTRFDALDSRFVPRREADERQRLIDVQYAGLETEVRKNTQSLDNYKQDVANARRWGIATFLTGGVMLLSVVVTFLR